MDRIVNLLFIALATMATVLNFEYGLRVGGFDPSSLGFTFSAIGTVLFVLLQFLRHNIRRWGQVIFLLIIASVAIWDNFDSAFGLGFALLSIYLAYKYRLVKRHRVLMVGVVAVFLAILILLSEKQSVAAINASILTIAFLFFFYAIFFLGESQWVRQLARSKEALERSKEELEEKQRLLADTLEEARGKQNDLIALKFTKKEIEVGRALIKTKALDKEIAYDLHISKHTLRNHFKSMRQKTNTETKQQLIDAIRWYYVAEEASEGENEEQVH